MQNGETQTDPFRSALLRQVFSDPSWKPESRAGWIVLIGSLLGFSFIATGITLFGGDPTNTELRTQVLGFLRSGALPDGTPWVREHFAMLYLPLFGLALVVRFGMTFLSPLFYERVCGEPLPVSYCLTMTMSNILMYIGPVLLFAAMGLAAFGLGFRYEDGVTLLSSAEGFIRDTINGWVPTIYEVPYPWPLLFGMVTGGVGYYWWHRLQHTWRPIWLLSHRVHHLMTHLVQPFALPASNPFAFFANSIPQALLIGIASKLFAGEAMVLEAILWVALDHTLTEVFNHSEPVYRWTLSGRLRWHWFHFWGYGAWHQLHHSSLPEHALVNIGGGPFMLWDRVFGTYCDPPLEKPPMGLTGRPPLQLTPLRIVFSGHVELVQDLLRNRSWKDRGLILLGPSSYQPPNAMHHLLCESPASRVGRPASNG